MYKNIHRPGTHLGPTDGGPRVLVLVGPLTMVGPLMSGLRHFLEGWSEKCMGHYYDTVRRDTDNVSQTLPLRNESRISTTNYIFLSLVSVSFRRMFIGHKTCCIFSLNICIRLYSD